MPTIKDDNTFGLVKGDILDVIGNVFTSDDDDAFDVADEFRDSETIRNTDLIAVPWTYRCYHTGDFQGLFPTWRELTIEGVTVIDTRGAAPMLRRYIDWLGVLTQLGVDVSLRLPVTEEEYNRENDS
jgi:hypothetical protein